MKLTILPNTLRATDTLRAPGPRLPIMVSTALIIQRYRTSCTAWPYFFARRGFGWWRGDWNCLYFGRLEEKRQKEL